MPVKIITDSTCDITREEAQKLGLHIIPLTVSFGDDQFLDGVDIQSKEFYERLKKSSVMPKSSQPSPEQFKEVFKKYINEGFEIVCVLISSALSGTVQSANIAKQELHQESIVIVDSRTTTMALGSMALAALEMANKGQDSQSIITALEDMKKRSRVFVVIDTLKYLVMGGRLSTGAGIVGSVLGVKPIVAIEDGLVKTVMKARGAKKAHEALLQRFLSIKPDENQKVYILHSNCEEDAKSFRQVIMEKAPKILAQIMEVGATIGTHAGPGAIGLIFYEA